MAAKESTLTTPTNFKPNFVLFSSAFAQTPFFRSCKPSMPQPNTGSSDGTHELHRSLAVNVEKFFGFIRSLSAHNPLIQKAVSLSAEFQAICREVRMKNSRRVSFPLSEHGFAAVLPGDSVAGMVVANGLMNFFNIYNTLLVVRLVLTWFPNTPPAIVSPLSTICDPYLNIFRGIIPPLGGTLDLSPILAFLVLNAFTSTAAALPCELPPVDGSSPSSLETKWMRRTRLSRKNQTKAP